jgi:translation elongation factor EF-G
MGELHLDVLATRLMRQFQVKAKKGKITISYREGNELNPCMHAN